MPASDPRGVRRLLPALVWFHRWLGVATCLIFAAWFASGAVMLFHPFPSLPHAAQMAVQAPVDARSVAIAPAAAASMVDGAEDLRLAQRAGRPAYLVGTAGGIAAIDARTGTTLPPISPAEALREGRRVFGAAATVVGPFDYDQWVVHNRFDAARPFYRLDAGDAAGTQLYLSARTGELLQRTTRAQRGWNWTGAVLHWVYVTPLRKSWSAWDRSVWWLSLICLAVAVAGTVLGIVRMFAACRLTPPRISFYRARWLRWHHLLGLGSAVFVLGWIVSGWLSMDHGRLFSRGTPTAAQAHRYAGCSLAEMLRGATRSGMAGNDGAREVSVTALACRAVLTHYAADGGFTRTDDKGGAINDASMQQLVRRAAVAGWPTAPAARIIRIDPTTTYALAEGWPASTWRVRLGGAALPDLYVDGATGRLLTVMDGSRAAYAWFYYALHTGNVPGLSSHPVLRRIVVLPPLAAGFLFSVTGVVLAWRRLCRAARRA